MTYTCQVDGMFKAFGRWSGTEIPKVINVVFPQISLLQRVALHEDYCMKLSKFEQADLSYDNDHRHEDDQGVSS